MGISNDAFTQLFMVLVLLNVYNMFLAALRPWRSLELNIFEFVLNLVFVVLLLCQFPVSDSHLNAGLFRNFSFCADGDIFLHYLWLGFARLFGVRFRGIS